MPLTAPAIKIRQKDTDIYLTTLTAGTLVRNYRIAYWTSTEEAEGYQRPLRDARISQIRTYLLDGLGTLPTSVLANVRGEISCEPLQTTKDGTEICMITVPDKSLPLWIIDGQHRVEGLKAAVEEDSRFAQYPVILSLFTLPKVYDEMMQFHIVNSRAKSVPTDLAQRHIYQMTQQLGLPRVMIQEGTKEALAAYAVPVVDKLAGDPSSPWYQKIQMPDQARKLRSQVIKQRPLADSVQYIISQTASLRKNLNSLAKMLIDYWNALAEIFPEAFADPSHYTIQATPGTYSLHYIFPDVYELLVEGGSTSKEAMKQLLQKMFERAGGRLAIEINDNFWSKEINVGHFLAQATSQKLIKALAQYFREALSEE